jgi:hypothetical protein
VLTSPSHSCTSNYYLQPIPSLLRQCEVSTFTSDSIGSPLLVTRTSIPFPFDSKQSTSQPSTKKSHETAKMFMKQYNYKPRTNSQSSQSGSGNAIERTDNAARADSPPAKADTTAATAATSTSPVSAAIAGRRRVCLPIFFSVSYLEAEAATRCVSPPVLISCQTIILLWLCLHMANTASPCSHPT